MSKRRSKRPSGPRRKRMNRAARLQSARSTQWVEQHGGTNLPRAYRKWFGVDPLCAFIELTALGVPIAPERRPTTRAGAVKRPPGRVRRKQVREEIDSDPSSDGTFAFIAGYTTAGFAYGVTREEVGRSPLTGESDRSLFTPGSA